MVVAQRRPDDVFALPGSSVDDHDGVVRKGVVASVDDHDGPPVPAHEAILGGCDLAAITTTDEATTVYSPPRHRPRDAELFVVVQPCEGRNPVVRLVAIGDRRRVLRFPGERWGALSRVRGASALVVPIPDKGREALEEFQVVALQYGEAGPNAWVTPAATFGPGSAHAGRDGRHLLGTPSTPIAAACRRPIGCKFKITALTRKAGET